ncbi:N-succinylarginine dihydrolase [Aquabacterium sp. A7-Y]|uniref:N-succinylarginine dihydrolase n=1 Tax=Aquabacterium sp. A7-Y TaxID=1349605 RepID=UPI00223DEDED|nr:N-succinylarginine dihydrolase [Aquabacterium sp. A7-Y]MCW7539757.1 N-succinylarginine dihydrolase [Aquabacterium sp. A7-Y]
MSAKEYNFDGLVGPTHNYAGLSSGNVASMRNREAVSNPRQAALQGLDKMLALADRGVPQGVLPPLARPNLALLRQLGFGGEDAAVVARAAREEPRLLAAAYSASAMWTANAATVSPSADTTDGRVHFTPANLYAKLHRAQEHADTARSLRAVFGNSQRFAVHDALPAGGAFGDEGAANHTRFATAHGSPGVELFVYGRSEFDAAVAAPRVHAARQTVEASRAVARLHGLHEARVVYVQQNPAAIDAGVFHNDVIAVGNLDTLLYHEDAFADEAAAMDRLASACAEVGVTLRPVRIARGQMSVDDAVASYLFNSQLLARGDGRMLLVVPQECREHERVSRVLDELVASGGPIAEVQSFDLRQSMRNGGGPACLRLRVVLTEAERAALRGRVLMTAELHRDLSDWVRRHYRDRLAAEDLADPRLIGEVRAALAELQQILELPGLYPQAG